MELHERIDGVGRSEVDRWVMEKCLENRRGRKCLPLLTCIVNLTF
jgi:hypothetical protein